MVSKILDDFVAILMIKSFQFVESSYSFWICLYQFSVVLVFLKKFIETKHFFQIYQFIYFFSVEIKK